MALSSPFPSQSGHTKLFGLELLSLFVACETQRKVSCKEIIPDEEKGNI